MFSEITKNFGNLAALVDEHVSNEEFAQNFLNLVANMVEKYDPIVPTFTDPAYRGGLIQIKKEHPANTKIQDLYVRINEKLSMQLGSIFFLELTDLIATIYHHSPHRSN